MGNSLKLSAKDITLIGLMVAIIEVCKVLMKDLPNIELTTFWIIMFTLYFGKKIIYDICYLCQSLLLYLDSCFRFQKKNLGNS